MKDKLEHKILPYKTIAYLFTYPSTYLFSYLSPLVQVVSGFEVPDPDYSHSSHPDVYFTHVEKDTVVQYSIRNSDCYKVTLFLPNKCS